MWKGHALHGAQKCQKKELFYQKDIHASAQEKFQKKFLDALYKHGDAKYIFNSVYFERNYVLIFFVFTILKFFHTFFYLINIIKIIDDIDNSSF